jgi:DNA-binding NarL/FixJ family response regulator
MRWAKQEGLNDVERHMIHEAIGRPDVPARRETLFWLTAKRRFMGGFSYDVAMERHKQLNSREWLVAYLTSQGEKQGRIAELTYMSERMVDETICSLKVKIAHDLDCDTVGIARITRWFIGS